MKNLGKRTDFEHTAGPSLLNGQLTGVPEQLNCHNVHRYIDLGFVFPSYAGSYEVVTISRNGLMQFAGAMLASDATNSTDDLSTHVRLAPRWDDLRTDRAGDDVYINARPTVSPSDGTRPTRRMNRTSGRRDAGGR